MAFLAKDASLAESDLLPGAVNIKGEIHEHNVEEELLGAEDIDDTPSRRQSEPTREMVGPRSPKIKVQ
jgi:hypothetical protein